MYNFKLNQAQDNVNLGHLTTPGRIYRTQGTFAADPTGAEITAKSKKPYQRAMALTAIEAAVGLAGAGGLMYAHRKKDVGWYCSILASLVWAGIGAHTVRYITSLIWEAADPIKGDLV